MKKIVSMSIVLSLLISCFSASFAAETTSVDKNLSLDEVKEIVLLNDVSYKNAVEALELAVDELSDAEFYRINIDWDGIKTADAYSEKYLAQVYDVPAATVALEQAKRDILNLEVTTNINTTESYIKLYNLKLEIGIEETDLLSAKKDLETATVNYELGLITDSDLESFSIAVTSAELNLRKAEQSYTSSEMSFNLMLDYPIDTELNLTDKVDTTIVMDYTIDGLLENYDTSSEDVIVTTENHELDVLKMDTTESRVSDSEDKVYDGNPSYYTSLDNTLDDYDDDYQDLIDDGHIALRTSYNNLLNSETSALINHMNYERALESQEIAILKYDLGMITKDELEDEKIDTYNSYTSMVSGDEDLYISYLEFEHENNYITDTSSLDEDTVELLIEKYEED